MSRLRSHARRRALGLTLSLAMALAVASSGPAPVLQAAIRPASRPTAAALLVGIDEYAEPSLSRQTGTTRVATLERLAALLREDYGLDVRLMSNAEATTANLYRVFDELSTYQASGGYALVVLATETREVEGVTRVATYDARSDEPWALPSVSELRALMSRAGDGGVLVADGCVSPAPDPRLDLRQMQVRNQRYQPAGKIAANVALLSGCPLGTGRAGDSIASVLARVLEELPPGASAYASDLARRMGAAQPYFRIELDPGSGSEPLVLQRAGTPGRVLARLDEPSQRADLLAELGNPKQAASVRGTPEAVPVTARLLVLAASGDEPEPIRAGAASALAAIGGDAAWGGLRDQLMSGVLGPVVGVAAVRALAAQGESAAPVLRAALETPDAIVVKEAVSALGALGRRDDLQAVLAAAHRTGDPEVQIAALSAVRRLGSGDLELAGPVRGLLETPSAVAEVRSTAVLALGELGDETMTGAIAHRLRADRDATVRQAAASALGQLAERTDRPEAVAALRAALDDDSELVREAAVVALGRLRVAESRAGLVSRLEDRAPAVRSAAAEALGLLDDTNAVEPLVEALGDADSSVRRASARALGEIGDAAAHEALIWKSATDADLYVRSAAVEALDRLGCAPLAADQLAVGDRDPRVRAAEVAWLSRCRHPAARELLLRALSDPDESVRHAAATGLATLPGAGEVVAPLEALARGGGVAAVAAIDALGQIGGDQALRIVLDAAAAERSALELRVAALRALGGFASGDASRVLLEAAAGSDGRLRAVALTALGMQARTYYLAEDWETGISVTERYLELASGSLGPAELAEAANNLAALYQRSGNLARAQVLLEEALALREKALGPDHPATAVSLNNLAALYQGRGESERAEPLFLKALKIRERALPPGDPDTVQSMRNLATLYEAMGRSDQAAQYRAQAERAEKQRTLLDAGR